MNRNLYYLALVLMMYTCEAKKPQVLGAKNGIHSKSFQKLNNAYTNQKEPYAQDQYFPEVEYPKNVIDAHKPFFYKESDSVSGLFAPEVQKNFKTISEKVNQGQKKEISPEQFLNEYVNKTEIKNLLSEKPLSQTNGSTELTQHSTEVNLPESIEDREVSKELFSEAMLPKSVEETEKTKNVFSEEILPENVENTEKANNVFSEGILPESVKNTEQIKDLFSKENPQQSVDNVEINSSETNDGVTNIFEHSTPEETSDNNEYYENCNETCTVSEENYKCTVNETNSNDTTKTIEYVIINNNATDYVTDLTNTIENVESGNETLNSDEIMMNVQNNLDILKLNDTIPHEIESRK